MIKAMIQKRKKVFERAWRFAWNSKEDWIEGVPSALAYGYEAGYRAANRDMSKKKEILCQQK